MTSLYTRPPGVVAGHVVEAGATVVEPTDTSAVYVADGTWDLTIESGASAGVDPSDGPSIYVPLRDVVGALVGVWTDRVVQGYIVIEVLGTPPSDGDDIIAWAGVAGSVDWSAGLAAGAIMYRSSRVHGPIEGTEADPTVFTVAVSPAGLTAHSVRLTWASYSGGAPGSLTTADLGNTRDTSSGPNGVFAADSYLALGAYCESSPGGDLTVRVRATAYIVQGA